MKKVIAFVNQFFGQVGGEEMAGMAPELREGMVGPALAMQAQLKDGKVTHTIICGDNYMASNTADALATIKGFLSGLEFDMLIAGPAFNAGRYGFSCGEVCKLVQNEFGRLAVTSMSDTNPGAELYRKDVYIVKGSPSAAGMRKDMSKMMSLANKLLNGEELLGADAEGYFPRGVRKEVPYPGGKNAADRVMDMLLAKLNGQPYVSEYKVEQEEAVKPLPAIDVKGKRIAFVTTGGFVPMGNPDRIASGSCTHYGKYFIGDQTELKSGDWISVHGGYNVNYVAENPMLLVPLDAFHKHMEEGHFASLHPYVYSLSGNQTTKGDSQRMAREILADLRNDGVDAVIVGST